MKNKSRDPLQAAKEYAFLLLKFRLRSEKELYQRLEKRKFDAGVIKQVLSFLKEKDFIDDNIFARAWIESRLKKPFGLRRIKQELKLKGIDKEIIESQAQEIKNNYPESEIVSVLAKEKFKKLRGIEPQRAKQRIWGYLLRRGFSPDVIIDSLNKL